MVRVLHILTYIKTKERENKEVEEANKQFQDPRLTKN
jgi:hypothetical protein